MHKILLKLDKNGVLINPGETIIYPADRDIIWKPSDPRIELIKICGKIQGDNPPFVSPLPSNFETSVSAKVNSVSITTEWHYNIEWQDSQGVTHICDPKITVKPGGVPNINPFFIFLFGIVVGSFFGNYAKWHKKKK